LCLFFLICGTTLTKFPALGKSTILKAAVSQKKKKEEKFVFPLKHRNVIFVHPK
jgi:hypothetical protein